MQTYKIYNHNHTEPVSIDNYEKWLIENAPFYFIGPHITADNREIYTAYTVNLPGCSCFTTYEIFLDENSEPKENIYHADDWMAARKRHKKLLKEKKEKHVSLKKAFIAFS